MYDAAFTIIDLEANNSLSRTYIDVIRNEVMPKAYRLNQRQNDMSDADADIDADIIESQKANAQDFNTKEQAYVTTIDSSQTNWQKKLNNN